MAGGEGNDRMLVAGDDVMHGGAATMSWRSWK